MARYQPLQPILPGDNAKYVSLTSEIMKLPPTDLSDPKSIRATLNRYLDICERTDSKPLVTGFALAFKMSRQDIIQICHGDYSSYSKITDDGAAILRNFYFALEAMWEQYMMNGQVNPASGIFLGKNNFNYKDVVETVVTKKKDATPKEIIERKYNEIPEN